MTSPDLAVLEVWLDAAVALAWKASLTALVIIAVAAVAERAGPVLAAVLMGLPISVGPALTLLAYTHGGEFVEQGARHALAAVFGVMAFLLAYVWSARRFGLWHCLLAGYGAWLACALVIGRWELNVPGALGLALAGLALAHFGLPRSLAPAHRPGRTPFGFLLLRGVLAGLAVGAVVTAGQALGPALAGFFATIPVILGSSAWMLSVIGGPALATATLSHADRGMLSFVAFCLTVASLAGTMSIYSVLGLGALGSVLVSVLLVARLQHR